uniref:Protein krueppel n=1 Tax=Anopheles culicifacies TaxID=139723 RepID=A0A182MCW4_9DIPT
MENTDSEDQGLTIQLTFCRICAVLSTDEYCIYERVYKDGTLSMHMMLEKLVPPVFNAEQVKVDEFMRFPRKICRGCSGKVLEAYTLYEMSMSSGDLLRKRLSSKKNTTFIVNITGGSTETTGVRITAPQTRDTTPVRISRQSRETTIDAEHQKEQIVQEDTFSNEEPKDQLVDTCPNLLDKHLNLSEIEDQPSSSEASAPKVKINQFPCVLCNESTFALPNELTEHWKAAHAEQIHCCKQCPKVFITKATYEHHQYCHATGRSHFCIFCDKGFQTEHLLKNHMRTHTHGTGFLCSQCGKEFSDRSNLRQHEYRHTGHKPWQCDLCPSRFSTKGSLQHIT